MAELAVTLAPRASERYCGAMARREAANFYWGFLALPRRQRIAVYALYDFARQVDDAADGAVAGTSRDALLHHHRDRLRRARPDDTADPVMGVLAAAMQRYAIPREEIEMLIDGVAMDLEVTRYASWEDLRSYCMLVAAVVGRMCVRIFGYHDSRALARADELGIALQLINMLRDVREDAARGRVYLPLDELHAHGIDEDDILAERTPLRWRPFVQSQAARARERFAEGIAVTELVPYTAGVCVRTMAGLYLRILERIEADPYLPLRERISLSPATKLGVMARSWLALV
jgi:phytoene synthase